MLNIFSIGNICDNSSVLSVMYMIKIIINLIQILVPIALLVSLMIKFASASMSNDSDALNKTFKSALNNIIAALLIFFVPSCVQIVINLFQNDNLYLSSCYVNANPSYIATRKEIEQAEKDAQKAEYKKKQEAAREEALKKEEMNNSSNDTPITTPVSPATDEPSVDLTSVNMDISNIGCNYNATGVGVAKRALINTSIANQFVDIMKNICRYVTTQATWVGQIEQAGTYVSKGGMHGKGLAIDMNTWYEYNGIKPYTCSKMQGPQCYANYKNFVCKVCNGNENCKYNINYIIYNRYFKNNGWCWGGYWSEEYFDPIHFEKNSSGNCNTIPSAPRKFTCN